MSLKTPKNNSLLIAVLIYLFIITYFAMMGGVLALILPGLLVTMSPDKWYDDPFIFILIGLSIGGGVGCMIATLVKRRYLK